MPDCPTPRDLERLLADESPEPSMRAHVAGCRPCQSVLETLSDDPALGQWFAGKKPPPWEDAKGAALNQLLDRLRGQPQESGLGTLGPYRILAELGRGGMGIVFKAFDDDLQRLVAIKVLHPDLTEDKDRRRFLCEAQIAARFRHDHAVTVHAVVNPPAGRPYLVMEYVEGPALNTLIRSQGYLKPPEAVAIVVQVADGLTAAHAAGLIHRDVKPSNILIAVGSGQ